METEAVRILIRAKLKNGRLPCDDIPQIWGGPGNGERCNACDTFVTKDQLEIEALIPNDQLVIETLIPTIPNEQTILFHVHCFLIWQTERQELKSSGSLPSQASPQVVEDGS